MILLFRKKYFYISIIEITILTFNGDTPVNEPLDRLLFDTKNFNAVAELVVLDKDVARVLAPVVR